MHQSIDYGGRGHGVFEDTVSLTEDQIAVDHQATAFLPLCEERKEHFHLFGALLDIAYTPLPQPHGRAPGAGINPPI